MKGVTIMKERSNQLATSMQEKRLLDVNEVCMYLNLGRCRGVEFAKSIGAERKIGRRSLFDKKVIDEYFDEQMQEV